METKTSSGRRFISLLELETVQLITIMSFHFQEDSLPVSESPESDLHTERTSSVLKSSPDESNLEPPKNTVSIHSSTVLVI